MFKVKYRTKNGAWREVQEGFTTKEGAMLYAKSVEVASYFGGLGSVEVRVEGDVETARIAEGVKNE